MPTNTQRPDGRDGEQQSRKRGEEARRQCLLVLGMHRSGTSALTRVLSLAGAALPRRLMGGTEESNPTGHWEPYALVAYHDELLAELGSSWDDWRQLRWSGISAARQKEIRREILEIIRTDYGDASPFVLKDPRICRFVPLYKDILNAADIAVLPVLVVRNPLEVMDSLARRDGMERADAALLWLRHVLEAERATRGQKRVFVEYGALLEDWQAQLDRIVTAFGLRELATDEDTAQVVAAFLDPKLRHSERTGEELNHDPVLAGWVLETWKALATLVRTPASREAMARLDEVAASLDAAMPFLQARLMSERRLRTRLEEQLENERSRAAELERQLETERAHNTELKERIEAERARADHLQAENASLQRRLSELEGRLQHVEAFNEALLSSTSWRITRPLRAASAGLREAYKTIRAARHVIRSQPGILATLQKTVSVYRLHGLGGLKARITIVKNQLDNPVEISITDSETCFVDKITSPGRPHAYDIRTIAFYLPQYHPIPENDEWWGEGFTEWTNVRPARPLFPGHYQPHEPLDELGYYDLRDDEVMLKQIELAKLYGISGFCFYFYWFGGKTLLEMPLRKFLDNKNYAFPFCICWANENWTRTWDGLDREVLIAQEHSPEDDIRFISHVSRYLRDERYIRINGKPLLIVYRPSLLPNARETAERWRQWCRENGIGEIYLACTQSFDKEPPETFGFDAAIEFPPNNTGIPRIPPTELGCVDDFTGNIYDWSELVRRSERYDTPDYRLFRGLCPSWDNTARRGKAGTILVNESPEAFETWMRNAIRDTRKRFSNPDERLIFINAWNEWAEGCHLEPDTKYGYAFLNSVRRALERETPSTGTRVAVVSHDAHPHGAQMLALNICRMLTTRFSAMVDCVLLKGGALTDEFAKVATRLHRLEGEDAEGEQARRLAARLRADGIEVAICNTTVTGRFARTLAREGIRVISLIHELPVLMATYNLGPDLSAIAEAAEKIVCASEIVARNVREMVEVDPKKLILRPQGLYKRNRFRNAFGKGTPAYAAVRERHGIGSDASIILGVGYGDRRKGLDLFIDIAERAAAPGQRVFIWVGHRDRELELELDKRIRRLVAEGKLVLTGFVEDTDPYYAAADVLALTSREDPYPSIVLEALDVGLPAVGFTDASGTCDLIRRHGGALVPQFDTGAFAKALLTLLEAEDSGRRSERARRFRQSPDLSFQGYVHDLLALLGKAPPKVSVIVPNYNYARYLSARLRTILAQTFPISELIVLDDASTDDSLDVIEKELAHVDIPVRVVVNSENSGSVFQQWLKGAEMARGDFIWIAEADDLSEPDFLDTVMRAFRHDDVVLSYCQSKQMAADGTILSDHYLDYVRDISPTRWTRDYVCDGLEEIASGLNVKNTIPNVSAVVFRRTPLLETLRAHIEEITSYRVAGDWCTYVHLLKKGSCAFSARSLNLHRRHDESVTISRFGWDEYREIVRMQETAARILNAEIPETAHAYRRSLKKQFGLTDMDTLTN